MAYGALNSLLSGSRPPVQGNLAEAIGYYMPMGGGVGQGQFPPPPPPGGFAPQAAPSYSGSSFLDPENAMPIAAALMKGPTFGDALGNAFAAYGETSKTRKTRDYLAQNYPELAQAVQGGLPIDAAWQLALNGNSAEKPTDDMREYDIARQQGFNGTFMDFMVKMKEAGRNQVNIDTGSKLPTNYRWIDPQNQELGVEPIPGGPGEQMPAELAARIGLAKDALTRLDRVEEAAKGGGLTGVYDWSMGQLGRGEQGELNRELAAGAEALTRMLTGAGMNVAEAQREASLYLARPLDDAPTLANKVAQLKRRLEATVEQASKGRGGVDPSPSEGEWVDLGNGVRLRQK